MHFKQASVPAVHFPVPDKIVLKKGWACVAIEQYRFQVYGLVHGGENSVIDQSYHAEIKRELAHLIDSDTDVFVFFEGGLNRYVSQVNDEKKCKIWCADHDLPFTQNVSTHNTLPAIYCYAYRDEQDVPKNVQKTKNAIAALERVSQKKNFPQIEGNQFFHTVDTLLMTCRVASKLFERGEGTSSLIVCGALHAKQIETYLRHLNRLYRHVCHAMKRLGVHVVPLQGVRTVTFKEMNQFVMQNPAIFEIPHMASSV